MSEPIRCSFCSQGEFETEFLIAASQPGAFICVDCVFKCINMVQEEHPELMLIEVRWSKILSQPDELPDTCQCGHSQSAHSLTGDCMSCSCINYEVPNGSG